MKLDQYALGNGSKIAWAEYGDPSGSPVLLLHGLVGSILSEGMEEQLQELPLRVIAIARPAMASQIISIWSVWPTGDSS